MSTVALADWKSSYVTDAPGAAYTFISVTNISTSSVFATLNFIGNYGAVVSSVMSPPLSAGETWQTSTATGNGGISGTSGMNGSLLISSSSGNNTDILPWAAIYFYNRNSGFSVDWTTTTGGGAAFLPLTSGVSYGNLVGKAAQFSTGVLVVPGDSTQSALYLRVSGTSLGAQMPKGGAPLSVADQNKIKGWIDAGAANNGPLPVLAKR